MDASLKTKPLRLAGWFLLFLICGLVVFLTGMSFSEKIPDDIEQFLRPGLALSFLALALVFHRMGAPSSSWQVFYAFFIATLAVYFSWKFAGLPLKWLSLRSTTPEGCALAKVSMSLCWIVPILLLVKLGGGDMASLYLARGRLKLGLLIGMLGFGFFAATSIFAAQYLFKARNLTLSKAGEWVPWILIFVLFNAAGEELIFRGLFLKRIGAVVGPTAANICIAVIFTMAHMEVGYSANVFIFMAIILPLALGWGYLMQKTDSIWGSILFHAGADIPVMLGMFSNFP